MTLIGQSLAVEEWFSVAGTILFSLAAKEAHSSTSPEEQPESPT